MRKFKVFKISCLLLAILVGCNDKDDELKVSANVVFLKKEISGEVRYGVSYYLQANQRLDSVTVTLPLGGRVVKLKQHETNTYLFSYEASNADFTEIAPSDGNYLFKAASQKGEHLEITDEQRFDDLAFAVIDSTSFDSGNLWYYVSWERVFDADAYMILLLKLSGKSIFNSVTIPSTSTTEYMISDFHPTGTWEEKPQKGQRYILRINSIKYDSATGKDEYFNVQEISAIDREITWELE